MLNNNLDKDNRKQQRESLLSRENKSQIMPQITFWKRGVLLAFGIIGLNVIAFFVTLFTLNLPKEESNAIVNLVTYALLFIAMIGFIFLDIPKLKKVFRGWENYVMGFVLGISVIFLDLFYMNFVNLFYPLSTGGNETSVRSLIDSYPIASIFILGIIGPCCEELAYRVGLFGLLRKVNIYLAYFASALVFGFLHFDVTSANIAQEFILLPSYIIPGLVFAFGYNFYGFSCSWTAHALNNLWAIVGHIISTRI